MNMPYVVDLIAGPLPEGTDVADVADRLGDVLLSELPAAAVGGRLDVRTIGVTAQVDAPGIEEALHRVVTVFERVSQTAGLAAQLPVIHGEVGLPDAAAHVAA